MAQPQTRYKPVQIQSRVNGLVVGIPAEVRGVVNRFRTKGDNELVFEQGNVKFVEPKKIIVGGADDVEPASDLV